VGNGHSPGVTKSARRDAERDRETEVKAVVNRLADEIDPDVLGAEIGDLIIEQIAEFAQRGDDDLRRNTQMVAIRTLRDVWHGVRMSTVQDDFDPPFAAVAWAAELVHRGVELHALLRAYRIGHDLVERAWETAASRLEPDGELRARSLERAFRFFFSYVDAISVQLTRIYLDERARWVRGSAAVRAEMARSLIAGERIPASKATSALGYDVAATHVGFIVWMEPSEPDDERAAALEAVAHGVGNALGDGACMLIPVGNWLVWGWTHQTQAAARPPLKLAPPAGLRVAVGSAAAGMDGLVQTHQEAVEARRVGRLLGQGAGPAVFHEDVALLELLTASPVAARRFVVAELGALAEADEQMTRLRATLRVYFDENLSPVRTSRRLGVNKNTIVYRVAKVEEILGHDVVVRRRELEAAVLLSEVHDAMALEPGVLRVGW
jgi:hypothetical protein